MNLDYILNNEELNTALKNAIRTTHFKYKLSFIIDIEDFEQEVYLYIMKRIKNYNEEKGQLKTYITLMVMSCAKTQICKANGQSKTMSKLDFTNSFVSMDKDYKNNENKDINLKEVIGIEEDFESKIIVNEILQMKNLSSKQKLIIYLMSKGYTNADIARKLNKTLTCINITFQRAKEKIVRKYAN